LLIHTALEYNQKYKPTGVSLAAAVFAGRRRLKKKKKTAGNYPPAGLNPGWQKLAIPRLHQGMIPFSSFLEGGGS